VLSCVETCRTFDVYRNREKRKLELVSRIRKCLFLYQYWRHREFGFLSARMQTWFPFSVQVCMNGREWLARQMDRVLRGGVADLHRRAEISERATERYLDALAGVHEQTSLQELLDRLGPPQQWKGRRVRALHPLGGERALLETICRGEFMLNGFVIGICRNSSFLRRPRICERPVGARRGSVGNCGCSGPTE